MNMLHFIVITAFIVQYMAVTFCKAEEVVIGSKEEALKVKNVLGVWGKLMNEEKFEEMEKYYYKSNFVLIVNGHKPVYGINAGIDDSNKMEEWGPGITIEIQEYIVSESNDLAVATGIGAYKAIEELNFLCVLKKSHGGWLAHIVARHQWVKEEMEGEDFPEINRDKREIVEEKLRISGNNSGAIDETRKLFQEWDKHFKANDAEGLAQLYSEDAVIMDNKNRPLKGQKYVAETFKKMMVNFGTNSTWTIMGMTTSTAGDLVVIYGFWHDGDSFGNFLSVLNGQKGRLKFRYSVVAHETTQ